MEGKDSKIIIGKLKTTLAKNKVDYENIIKELGQVEAAEKRKKGHHFKLNEHIKGLILSMLSNHHPWKFIAPNIEKLDTLFLNYDPEELENADPHEMVKKIEKIKCGNLAINQQMEALKHNIKQFRKIELEYDSLDKFIESKTPEEVAKKLSDHESPYKLIQIGPALAMEYLKNVGINGIKPDVHIIRICGPERLELFSSNDLDEIIKSFQKLAKNTDLSMIYLDNLFWIFGAQDYGEICSSTPKCNECQCELRPYCNYPQNHPSKIN